MQEKIIQQERLKWFKPSEQKEGEEYADILRHPDYKVTISTNRDGHFYVARTKKEKQNKGGREN